MKLIKNNKDEGFTLIELVVVIAILAILALILIPSLMGYNKKAEISKNEANARNVYTAATVAMSEDDTLEVSGVVAKLKEGNLVKVEDWSKVQITGSKTDIKVTVGDGDRIGEYPKSADKKSESK